MVCGSIVYRAHWTSRAFTAVEIVPGPVYDAPQGRLSSAGDAGMTTDQVSYLNIGLMATALAAAISLPFEVFLLSYAILGPLHYLTEISWLHDRQYFSPRQRDWIPFVALSGLILLGTPSVLGEGVVGVVRYLGFGGLLEFLSTHDFDLTFFAFGLALLFILLKGTIPRILGALVLLLAAAILHGNAPPLSVRRFDSIYWTIFAIYIPTIIHVYLFTAAFILYGALKRHSRADYLSLVVFFGCTAACFLLLPDTSGYTASPWARANYETFESLHRFLLRDVRGVALRHAVSLDLFTDRASVLLARFIAFAYTYHYLNWFSKTSVIQWHKISRGRFVTVIAIWMASVSLYMLDYSLGFRWLFFLSFTHVVLEFPLNHQTFVGIGREVYGRLGRVPAVAKG